MGETIPKNKIHTTTTRKDYSGEKLTWLLQEKLCLTSLLKISEGVNRLVQQGALADTVYLDPQKALVSVLKQRFTRKLSCFSMGEAVFTWRQVKNR